MNTPRDAVQPSDRHLAVARAVVFEGKTFREAMLAQSFGARRAMRTQRSICERSAPFRTAFEIAEAERRAKTNSYGHGNSGDLKTICVARLKTNIEEGEDRGTKSVALLGRFKENDWFVREGSGTMVGIFATFSDPDSGALLDQMTSAMKDYPEFPCAWCGNEHRSAEELQTHALVCTKKPLTICAVASSSASNGGRP